MFGGIPGYYRCGGPGPASGWALLIAFVFALTAGIVMLWFMLRVAETGTLPLG